MELLITLTTGMRVCKLLQSLVNKNKLSFFLLQFNFKNRLFINPGIAFDLKFRIPNNSAHVSFFAKHFCSLKYSNCTVFQMGTHFVSNEKTFEAAKLGLQLIEKLCNQQG